jgi:hypothetical protein
MAFDEPSKFSAGAADQLLARGAMVDSEARVILANKRLAEFFS